LDILRVIVSVGTAHPSRINMIGHDVAIITKFFEANRAFPVLLDDLPLQQLPHFRGRP
jgi:hypothetical protein